MAVRPKAIAVLVAMVAVCFAGTSASRAEDITLYSTREAALVEPIVAASTEASGIGVKIVFVDDSLVKRLASEGSASPADVLLTIGLDKTTQPVIGGLTQTISSAEIEQAARANLRGGGVPIVADMGSFIVDATSIGRIAAHQQAAIALIKKAGFDE